VVAGNLNYCRGVRHSRPGAAGARFAPGDLIELETHKAVVEVPAGRPGALPRILSEPGDWQAVGASLALLSDSTDEPLPAMAEGPESWPVEFEVS
jgi:pyruvate/2-oxoglutarate dehydrogenase complex dihydrolipoamide acyltransferase (E2) component